jgi:hypothetical protein
VWREMPYDLLQVGRRLAFSLSELFPSLSSSVVAELDRGDVHRSQLKDLPK